MKPYNKEQTTKSEEVKEMFDTIAPKYDLLNHILSMQIDRVWRRRVVKYAQSVNPTTIIDLATGTGDLALALARRIPTAKIIAIDPSEGMLSVAKQKIERAGLESQISLRCAAAESLNMDSEQVDLLTVAFGVRNFGDLKGGLEQISRAVKRGGEVVILEFSTPDNSIFRWFYNLYARYILPFIGGVISKDRRAYEYLPASVEEFATPTELSEIMQSVGLKVTKIRAQSFGIARIYIAKKI